MAVPNTISLFSGTVSQGETILPAARLGAPQPGYAYHLVVNRSGQIPPTWDRWGWVEFQVRTSALIWLGLVEYPLIFGSGVTYFPPAEISNSFIRPRIRSTDYMPDANAIAFEFR